MPAAGRERRNEKLRRTEQRKVRRSPKHNYRLAMGARRGVLEDDVRIINRIASGLAASATVAALVTAVGAGVKFR
jgi:hypothetical protein